MPFCYLGVRQRWRVGAGCNPVAVRFSRFDSYYPHEVVYIFVFILLRIKYIVGERKPQNWRVAEWLKATDCKSVLVRVRGFESLPSNP